MKLLRPTHPYFPPGSGVDRGEPSATVADHQPPGLVGADIVGIVSKIDRSRRSQIIRLEEAHASIPGAGNGDKSGFGRNADPLRLMQAINLPDHLAGLEIHDGDKVVAEFANEQPVAREVDGEVINPTSDLSEVDGPFKR